MFKEVIQVCPYALINVRPHYHIHEVRVGDSRDLDIAFAAGQYKIYCPAKALDLLTQNGT